MKRVFVFIIGFVTALELLTLAGIGLLWQKDLIIINKAGIVKILSLQTDVPPQIEPAPIAVPAVVTVNPVENAEAPVSTKAPAGAVTQPTQMHSQNNQAQNISAQLQPQSQVEGNKRLKKKLKKSSLAHKRATEGKRVRVVKLSLAAPAKAAPSKASEKLAGAGEEMVGREPSTTTLPAIESGAENATPEAMKAKAVRRENLDSAIVDKSGFEDEDVFN